MLVEVKIARIQTFSLRASVAHGPTSSPGDMPLRNGLLVRIEDVDGAHGWGEIWCNFPPRGNEHRRRLIEDLFAPALQGSVVQDLRDLRRGLWARWRRMAHQVGEPGPFGQCFAGIDMALWDLHARRLGAPLCRVLAKKARTTVPVYASTPVPHRAADHAAELFADGHRAIKLKVGIDPKTDDRLVKDIRRVVGDGQIMVDANQNWTLAEATDACHALAEQDVAFVEEPISAGADMASWASLAAQSPIALAAGENISTEAAFAAHLKTRALRYFQPDVAKWGGVGGCFDVGQKTVAQGAVYCPHFMGTAVGLAASIHLLAAVGGGGSVELDANENPLRTDLTELDLTVTDGRLTVPTGAGIGVEPDPSVLRRTQID